MKPQSVEYTESLLAKHGDSDAGQGWPKGARARYEVIAEFCRDASILDVGCGTGRFLDYLLTTNQAPARTYYVGIDLSKPALEIARKKHPEYDFLEFDLIAEEPPTKFDVVVMNGLFTYRGGTDRQAMLRFWRQMTEAAWRVANRRIVFNLMSPLVEWRADELWYPAFDRVLEHVGTLSRQFGIRATYGQNDYVVYVQRHA